MNSTNFSLFENNTSITPGFILQLRRVTSALRRPAKLSDIMAVVHKPTFMESNTISQTIFPQAV